jgi:PAS domain S-box-containing protein
MRALFAVVLISFLLSVVVYAQDDDNALDAVSLHLKWRHQFQFAGYYAAIEKGFYREEGLKITLIEPGVGENSYDAVLAGDAEFGISNAEIVERYAKGAPLVQLAVIYQHSPLCLLSIEGKQIKTLHDLVGKKIMMEPSSADLMALFQYEGIDLEDMHIIDHGFSADPLLDGEVQAISAYMTDEPYSVKQSGKKPIVFTPRTYGIDFYGDGFFTSRKQVEEHPERVAAFRRASLKGWEYALQHPEEIVDLILSEYSQRKTREALLYEAQVTSQLVYPDLIEVGYMNPGRWAYIANVFSELGMIESPVNMEDLLYQSDTQFPWRKVLLLVSALLLIATTSGLLAWYFYRSNRKLEEAIQSRDEATTALRQSEKFFRDFFQTAPLAFVSWSPDLTISRWNPAAERFFGWSADEVKGRSFIELFVPENERPQVLEVVAELARDGSCRAANWNLRKDKSRIWCQWYNVAKYDDDGELQECQSIALDATSQYEREQHLLTEKEIAELANETKGEYLASVSHEIRNPLSAIVGIAELLKDETLQADVGEMAGVIATNGESLIRILNDLIDHEKLEAGVVELIPAHVGATDAVRKNVDLFRASAQENDVTLEFNSNCPEKEITIDTLRLQQIMTNLLSNAIKFTSEGTVHVLLDWEAENPLPLIIEVKDSGIGMEPEEAENIFKLYVSGNEISRRNFGGTGVGLAVCEKLVRLMNGTIAVHSEKGVGTTFTVRLPEKMSDRI